ncbi:unnamed protein product [Cercospora beticola]|nr:unnamed protein product [Cercospora beticola]
MTMANTKIGTEAIAVITGSFLSGTIMSLFLLTIPVITKNTSEGPHLIRQWSDIFHSGHRKGPGIAIATAVLYAFGAYTKNSEGQSYGIFLAAAATTVSMIPYTWVFMKRTNDALFAAEENGRTDIYDASALVQSWNRLNAIRALFPLAGAVLGMLGTTGLLSF